MASKKDKAKGGGAVAGNMAALLASAVHSTQTGSPFYASKEAMASLTANPAGVLVEFNEAAKNPLNPAEIAFRATALGVQYHQANPPPQAGTAPTGAAWPTQPQQGGAPTQAPQQTTHGAFTFDSGIDIPAARRGGRSQNAYGFEQMNIGQSFFIPATEDNPNPSKRVASTVSSASKRLDPKAFVVRSVDEEGRGKGARVWRTA
jgi:hypothetical protein